MKHKRGFTLIELLVTVAVFGLIVGGAAPLLLTLVRTYYKAQAIHRLNLEGNKIMEKMERLIRDAAASPDTTVAGQIDIQNREDSIEYQTNGRCSRTLLAWTPPTATANGYIEKTPSSCLDSPLGQGPITSSSGKDALNVTNLTFARFTSVNSPDTIKVEMSLGQDINQRLFTETTAVSLTSTVSLRNY